MTDKTRAGHGPMYVDATPLMVTCDVENLVHANVGELLDLLTGEFLDDFTELAQGEGGSYAFERLQARLVDHLSTKVSLTGPQAMRVAGRMAELARPLAAKHARSAAVVMKAQSRKSAAA